MPFGGVLLYPSMKLTSLFVSSVLATLPEGWSDCGNPNDDALISEYKFIPEPLVAGKNANFGKFSTHFFSL